ILALIIIFNPGKAKRILFFPISWMMAFLSFRRPFFMRISSPGSNLWRVINYPSLRDGRTIYMSDWFIEKGSFLRLQNLSVGYTINDLHTA
ncbi:hypothetical protein, partial [Vibrio cholerae]|uniref:hypothetical protein n=1 Tax=Vibrio cholerae TaxID=666 RepID=UPI0039C9CBBE